MSRFLSRKLVLTIGALCIPAPSTLAALAGPPLGPEWGPLLIISMIFCGILGFFTAVRIWVVIPEIDKRTAGLLNELHVLRQMVADLPCRPPKQGAPECPEEKT